MQLLTYFDSPSTFNELILNIDDDQCPRFEAVKYNYSPPKLDYFNVTLASYPFSGL